MLAATLVVTACGHRMERAELLTANGGPPTTASSTTSTTSSTGSGAAPVTSPAPAGASPAASGAPAAAAGSSATTVAGGSTPAGADGPCSTPGQTGPILIGAVGNYSGPAGSSHVGMARALQAWAQWTNDRGGLCGRRVQILTTDDHSDPAQFRSALQEMVERRHVVAFSNHDTLTGDSGISYLERVGVPGVGGSCSVSAEYDSPIFFLPCPRPDVLFFGMARNAALLGPSSKRFGLLTCREVAVCGATPRRVLLEEHGARDAGVQVVYEGQASIAQPDYTSECIGARSNHADTLAVILDLASVQRVGQACARQGFYPTYSLVTSIAATTKDLPGFRDLFVALPTFSFAGDATPAQREFHDVMAHYLGSAPGGQETVGWTSAKLLELAITTAATHRHEITPATVVEALHTLRSETLGGLSVPVSFPAGKPGTYPYCWFTVRATGGQWSAANGGKPLCRS